MGLRAGADGRPLFSQVLVSPRLPPFSTGPTRLLTGKTPYDEVMLPVTRPGLKLNRLEGTLGGNRGHQVAHLGAILGQLCPRESPGLGSGGTVPGYASVNSQAGGRVRCPHNHPQKGSSHRSTFSPGV